MRTEQQYPGLVFRCDELRDANTRMDEYRRRVELVASRTRSMQPQDMTLETSETFRWWADAGAAVAAQHQRAQKGFTFLEKLSKRDSGLALRQVVQSRHDETPSIPQVIHFPRQSR